ncbi:MAG: hypothetical protein ABL950_07765 [Nitrospira sp.]
MNILHYLNVLIGFSLVMLLLSIVTTFAAQTWVLIFKTKGRAVGNGLASMLEEIGFEKAFAKQNVDALLNKGSSIFGKKFGGALNKLSSYFLAGAPKHIGREEFVLLLLRKAVSDNELATKLGFADETGAKSKLQELEEAILAEETKDPTLPAHLWRTKAMQKIVPELASKIFARFDDVLDRATEDVSAFGKFLGILLTLPLLLINWPVDSIDLFDRLNKDQILSAKLATATETNLPSLQKAYDEFQKCRDGKTSPDVKDPCEQSGQALKKAANDMMQLGEVKGLFGENTPKELACKIPIVDRPIPFFEHCKRAELTSGIFVTWILVSLGSAFWLGLLDKMLGLRSELSKKLEAQREFRATRQA